MPKITFSVKSLEQLQANGKAVDYVDTKSRGLTLRVSPKGKKTFYLVRSVFGKTKRYYIGQFPDVRLAQATQKCGELNSEIDRGGDPTKERNKKRDENNLDDLFFYYYEKHAKQHTKRPDTALKNYRLYLSKIGNKSLSLITKSFVMDYHISLKNSVSGRTANIMLTLLKAIYNFSINNDDYEGNNPTNGIKKFKEIPRARFLDEVERERFLEEVNNLDDVIMKSFFLILIYTGQRKTNVLEMSWSDVSLNSKKWIIPVTKTAENFTVPLSEKAIKVLEGLKEIRVNNFVFYGAGKTGHLVEPKKAFKRILENAGIENFRLHDLRRTFASMLSEQGVNEFVIKDLLGHKSLDMTAIYARSSAKSLHNAVNSLQG